ncbi:MAG: hypothetical protein VKP72_01950 [bacterium]|nr:hypothetical protein [bacterium]
MFASEDECDLGQAGVPIAIVLGRAEELAEELIRIRIVDLAVHPARVHSWTFQNQDLFTSELLSFLDLDPDSGWVGNQFLARFE